MTTEMKIRDARMEGRVEGRREGRVEGIQRGRQEEFLAMLQRMYENRQPVRLMAEFTGRTEAEVLEGLKQLGLSQTF